MLIGFDKPAKQNGLLSWSRVIFLSLIADRCQYFIINSDNWTSFV